MTAMTKLSTGAPKATALHWDAINWQKVNAEVRRLQMRIAKAYRESKHGKVKSLQWMLTHSSSAKLLAVRRVTSNKGAKTPGIDNVLWNTPKKKMLAALKLRRSGYKAKSLKRVHIPKKQKGKFRPLSIPTMECRAQQALHLLALEPITEAIADKNSYGFRPLRSAADAIQQCFIILSRKESAHWVLEGDIRSCFENISHPWLLNNVSMDKVMLRKWLSAGYIEKTKLYSTVNGTPQGGVISPTLLLATLSGLEQVVKSAGGYRKRVNIITYADDFIITGVTKEVLENKVEPAVESFLRERGLTLSKEKTKITQVNKGFDFLGMNIRKYEDKLIIKPAKGNVKNFLADIRKTIKLNRTAKTEELIRCLNRKIRGWSNYYRHVCSSTTFHYLEREIFKATWKWSIKRHPEKSKRWIKRRYFRSDETRNWIFSTKTKDKDGNIINLDLEKVYIPIKRYIKFRAEANPYDPTYHEYIANRLSGKMRKTARLNWWLPWWKFNNSYA